jgi:hypothetical protein
MISDAVTFGSAYNIGYREDFLRVVIHDLDGFEEDLDLLEFVRFWRNCGSLAGLKILLQKFDTFVQAMSAEDTFRFFCASLTTRESAASYMAKIDLCCRVSSTKYFYRKRGASVLHHIANVFGTGFSDHDWEGWTRIGVAAIQNGANLLALRRYTPPRGDSCALTPLAYLLWKVTSKYWTSTEAISIAVERWTHMLDEAKIDLTTYYTRESKTGTFSHASFNLIYCTSQNTAVILAALEYDPSTNTCNLRLRQQISIPLMRLYHLPGSFPGPVEIPDTICWNPDREKLEEGHWSRSDSEGPVLRGRVMDLKEFIQEYDGSCPKLVDSAQDDNGFLMRIIDQSQRNSLPRKRSWSQPAPLHRRRHDYLTLRPRSLVHQWLPSIHFCIDKSAWILSNHGGGRDHDFGDGFVYHHFVDPRRCAIGGVTIDIDRRVANNYLSFVRLSQLCQAGDKAVVEGQADLVALHDGTRDCPEGCGKINFSTVSKPQSLPAWHPGSFGSCMPGSIWEHSNGSDKCLVYN